MNLLVLVLTAVLVVGMGIYLINLARPWLSATPAERAAKSQAARREYVRNLTLGAFLALIGLRMLADLGARHLPAYESGLRSVELLLAVGVIISAVALLRVWLKSR